MRHSFATSALQVTEREAEIDDAKRAHLAESLRDDKVERDTVAADLKAANDDVARLRVDLARKRKEADRDEAERAELEHKIVRSVSADFSIALGSLNS